MHTHAHTRAAIAMVIAGGTSGLLIETKVGPLVYEDYSNYVVKLSTVV